MFLRQRNFNETESKAPLMKENNNYLNNNPSVAWQESRKWPELVLNMAGLEEKQMSSNEDSKNDIFSHFAEELEDGDENNYGLRVIERPDRILEKDAIRTFLTEPKRKILISLLTMIKSQLGDYQQTISYVTGILLIFHDVETVFKMVYVLGRSPLYAMKGYWRSEAIDQAIDGFVLWRLLEQRNNNLFLHLRDGDTPVMPETFVQKWFGGLGVQCIPVEFLLPLWTRFFKFGFRYLFKFYLNLIDCLSDSLMNCKNTSIIYEILRLEKKQKYWQCCVNDFKNGKNPVIYKKSHHVNGMNGVSEKFGKLDMKNQVFKFGDLGFGNNVNHNSNGFSNNSSSNATELKLFDLLSEENKKLDQNGREFGIALFFTKVLALSDADDDKNDYIDKLDFEKEREIAWKHHLEKRLTGAAVSNTFFAMKISEQNDDCEDKDCEFCDDGFAEFYCVECKKYVCDTCQEEPTGDHTTEHKVKSLDETVDVD